MKFLQGSRSLRKQHRALVHKSVATKQNLKGTVCSADTHPILHPMLCYYHRGIRLNVMKRFCLGSLCSHLNDLYLFPLYGGYSEGLDVLMGTMHYFMWHLVRRSMILCLFYCSRPCKGWDLGIHHSTLTRKQREIWSRLSFQYTQCLGLAKGCRNFTTQFDTLVQWQ